MKQKTKLTLAKTLPFILLIGGVIGVLSSAILTIDKIHLLKNPGGALGCDINPIVACGSVINTPQASAFGFLNPLIGIAGFAILAAVGAGILAGARFKRWFWLALQLGVTFAVAFITWLQYQTIFNIGALCPYCMVVWSVTIPIFWYITLYNLREGHIKTKPQLKGFVSFIQRHHGDILFSWFLLIVAVITHHFWYYWKTLI